MAKKVARLRLKPVAVNTVRSALVRKLGAIAQLVAHLHGMQGVRGSNPLSSTKSALLKLGSFPQVFAW